MARRSSAFRLIYRLIAAIAAIYILIECDLADGACALLLRAILTVRSQFLEVAA